MLEKLIENWLDNTTERSFQLPFCSILTAKGFTVVHITRHCGMELGKDVIAIDPEGVPCAYQLKTAGGGKISLAQWQRDNRQLVDLVGGRLVHPSLPPHNWHRAFLVANGTIDEEVSRAIDDLNRGFLVDGNLSRKLETYLRGEFLKDAQELGTRLWPSELADYKLMLELFLEDGRSNLPKDKFAKLFEATLPLNDAKLAKKPSTAECRRLFASAALLCAIALTPFTKAANHVAEIEAWTILSVYVVGVAERFKLPASVFRPTLSLARHAIENCFKNLCDELQKRNSLLEGDSLLDNPFGLLNLRATWLIGLLSAYFLIRRLDGIPFDGDDDFIRDFCKRNSHRLKLWGEAAVPLFVCRAWLLKFVSTPLEADRELSLLLTAICELQQPKSKVALPSPHYGLDAVIASQIGSMSDEINETFAGKSFTLEGVLQLFVRRNWKQELKTLWPKISRVDKMSYLHQASWKLFRWQNQDSCLKHEVRQPTQDWQTLRKLAESDRSKGIPRALGSSSWLALLLLCVFPQRFTADFVCWLDSRLNDIASDKGG